MKWIRTVDIQGTDESFDDERKACRLQNGYHTRWMEGDQKIPWIVDPSAWMKYPSAVAWLYRYKQPDQWKLCIVTETATTPADNLMRRHEDFTSCYSGWTLTGQYDGAAYRMLEYYIAGCDYALTVLIAPEYQENYKRRCSYSDRSATGYKHYCRSSVRPSHLPDETFYSPFHDRWKSQ